MSVASRTIKHERASIETPRYARLLRMRAAGNLKPRLESGADFLDVAGERKADVAWENQRAA